VIDDSDSETDSENNVAIEHYNIFIYAHTLYFTNHYKVPNIIINENVFKCIIFYALFKIALILSFIINFP